MKTDAQLKDDVISELKWESSVNSNMIGVAVQDGIVTLTGHVNRYVDKLDAERAVQRVTGVKGLAVEIDVKLAGSYERNDADIARTVENVLSWSVYVPQNSIKVMVEKGWVTLSGALTWEFERERVISSISHLMGVTGVSNEIRLEPQLSSKVISADIEAAFKRGTYKDTKTIAARVEGDTVTLTGAVSNWYERDLAAKAAWNAQGVHHVINNITIVW